MNLYNSFISVFGIPSDSNLAYGLCVIFYSLVLALIFKVIYNLFHFR